MQRTLVHVRIHHVHLHIEHILAHAVDINGAALQFVGHQIIGVTVDILARLQHHIVLIHHQFLQVRLAAERDLLVREQIDRAGIVRRQQRNHGRIAQLLLGLLFVQMLDEDGARVVIHHHAVLVVLGVLHVARAARQHAGFALAPLRAAFSLQIAHQAVVLRLEFFHVGKDEFGIVLVGIHTALRHVPQRLFRIFRRRHAEHLLRGTGRQTECACRDQQQSSSS